MQPENDLLRDFHTDLSVGDILRRARIRSNASIEDIEFAIKVTKEHILAIEEGRFDDLPGRIYTIGFIRSYAEHMGLDSAKILLLLKRQTGKKLDPVPMPEFEKPISDDASLPSRKTFLVLFLFFIVAVVMGPSLFNAKRDTEKNETELNHGGHIPPVPDDLKRQMTLLSKPTQIPANAQSARDVAQSTSNGDVKLVEDALVAPKPVTSINDQPVQSPSNTNTVHAVTLKALANVWLEIRDDTGQTIFSRVLSAGEEYWVPTDQTGLVMTLGNAGGLEIMVEGETLPILGKTGKVIRNISLDASALKERLKNASKKAM